MEVVDTIALTMGVAWASGLNLYAAVAMLGLLATGGHIVLPPELAVVSEPVVIAAAIFMYCVEFFTDKVPGVDSGWDAIHTFIRIPAGAVLAAGAVGDVAPALQLAAGLVGGGIAAGAHATKAGSRVLVNTSPEPLSNWTLSIAEDLAVIGGLWAALNHPWVFLLLFAAFVALAAWLLPRIARGLRRLLASLGRLFSRRSYQADDDRPRGEPRQGPSAP